MPLRSSPWSWSLAFTLTAVALTWTASHASAQSDDDAARRHFRLGEAHYANGSFTEAAREFDEAYRLSQRPQLLYNVYVAYRDAGMVEEATRALREYLTRMPDAEDASNLRARLTAMERTLEERRSGTSTGGEPPPDQSESTSTGAEAETESTDTPSERSTDGDGSATPSSGGGNGTIGWVIAGVGAAFVIAGAITGGLALGSQGALQSNCPDHVCPPGYDYEGEASSGRALAVTTDVLLITGAAAIVGGVVLAIVLGSGGGSDDEPSVADHASIACGPTGCVALLRGEL